MLDKKLPLYAAISVAILAVDFSSASNVFGNESSRLSCPDISKHTSVLERGIQTLEALPAAYTHQSDHRLLPSDIGTNVGPSRQGTAMEDIQLTNFKFDSQYDFTVANREVYLLEIERRFDSAEKLLISELRALKAQPNLDVPEIAETLCRIGQLQIVKGIGKQEFLGSSPSRKQNFQLLGYGSGLRFNNIQVDVIPYMDFILDQGIYADKSKWDAALKFYDEAHELQKGAKGIIIVEPEYVLLLEAKGRLAEAEIVCLEALPNLFEGGTNLAQTIAKFCERQDALKLAKQLDPILLKNKSNASSILLRYYLHHAHPQEAVDLFITARDSELLYLLQTPIFSPEDIAQAVKLLPDSQKAPLRAYIANRFIAPVFLDHTDIILEAASARWNGFDWELFQSLDKQFISLKGLPGLILLGHHFSKRGQVSHSLAAYAKVLNSLTYSLEPDFNKKNALSIALLEAVNKDQIRSTPEGQALMVRLSNFREKCEIRMQMEECLVASRKLDKAGSQLELKESYREAERMYRESLSIKEKNLGANDGETLETVSDLARVVGAEGKVNEASALYDRCLLSYRKGKVPKDNAYARLLDSYVQCLSQNKQSKKADLVCDEARAYHNSLKGN